MDEPVTEHRSHAGQVLGSLIAAAALIAIVIVVVMGQLGTTSVSEQEALEERRDQRIDAAEERREQQIEAAEEAAEGN